MLLAYRLVRLIETHSEQLTATCLQAIRSSGKSSGLLDTVPPEEVARPVSEVYQHLGQWLLGKSESDIAERYTQIGITRAQQGVRLSELMWAILLVKDTLISFLKTKAVPELPAEAFGELEMLHLLEQFFDRAVFYAAAGYERAYASGAHRAPR